MLLSDWVQRAFRIGGNSAPYLGHEHAPSEGDQDGRVRPVVA